MPAATGLQPGKIKDNIMKNKVELMNLYWTTAGVFPWAGEISRFDFKDRVEAAARAGFKGIGIWHTDLEHVMLHRPLKEMKMILDDNGLKYLELEFLLDWFVGSPRKAEADARKRRLLQAAEALCAKHIKIGDFYNTPYSMPHLVEAFAALCREAENAGTTVGFELMGSSMIDNLKDAITLVETAAAKNGGLILDIVQVEHLGMTFEEISRIPLQYLLGIELNDGALPGSPLYDASRARRFCGEGDFDIQGLIHCVQNMGYAGPWAVEVMSEELAPLPLEELSTRAFKTTMAEFVDK
jgi:sugar phosphate isomerase/epimerase